jgi:hypothetical protein
MCARAFIRGRIPGRCQFDHCLPGAGSGGSTKGERRSPLTCAQLIELLSADEDGAWLLVRTACVNYPMFRVVSCSCRSNQTVRIGPRLREPIPATS